MFLAQFTFTVFFSSLVYLLLILSNSYQDTCRRGLFVLLGFSTFVVLANLCDYLHLNCIVFFFLAFATLCFLIYKRKRLKIDHRKTFSLWFFWQILVLLLFVPLLFVMPQDAVVSGHGVANDSVHHSFFTKGFKQTDIRLGIDDKRISKLRAKKGGGKYESRTTFLGSYPRGGHSFLYYCSELFPYLVPEYLLSVTLCFYSLTFFALISLFNEYSLKHYLISICSLISFLPVVSAYHLFFPQVACFPFVIGFLSFLYSSKTLRTKLPLSLMLACGVSIYGIFCLSLCVFGFILWLLFCSQNRKDSLTNFTYTLMLTSLFAFPSMFSVLKVFWLEINDSSVNALMTSHGNLASGYLSSAHLSGIWLKGYGYREALSGSSFLQLSGLFILIQSIFSSKLIFKKKIFCILLLTFLIPVLASLTFLKNPYINFKYLSILVPVFVFTSFLGVFEISNIKLRKFLVLVYFSTFLFSTFLYSVPAFASIPVLRLGTWLELKAIKLNYIDKGNTVVLTKEDWIQEFVFDRDDSAPLTQYLKRISFDQPDYLIVDKAYEEAVGKYFLEHPRLHNKVNNIESSCIDKISLRFYAYKLNCINESK